MKSMALFVALMCVAAASATVLYETQFTGGAGPEWTFSSFSGGTTPVVDEYNGSDQVKFYVGTDNTGRKESRAVVTFPTPIVIADWTEITIQYDLTLPVGGDVGGGTLKRHNIYYDFDNTPNRYVDQTINDGGATKMIAFPGRGEINIGATQPVETIVTMKWVFDIVAGTVNTYFGSTQIDTNLGGTLASLTGGPNFTNFSFALVKDWWSSPAGYTCYLDNFKVTGIPEPASLVLLALGAMLRRR